MTPFDAVWDAVKFLIPIFLALIGWILKLRADVDKLKIQAAAQEEKMKVIEAHSAQGNQQINQILVMLARLEERIERYFKHE